MNQNIIIFPFSDIFGSFQPMYSAEGGWTDSELDLVMWETGINTRTPQFPAFVRLCFMPVFKPTSSSCAWSQAVNINLIADHCHKSRFLLCFLISKWLHCGCLASACPATNVPAFLPGLRGCPGVLLGWGAVTWSLLEACGWGQAKQSWASPQVPQGL